MHNVPRIYYSQSFSKSSCQELVNLAVIFGEVFPGYRYGEGNAQDTRDVERMEAFLDGYGVLPDDFEETIDDYVLLRLLARYLNQFVPHQDSTIDLLITKQN